MFVYADTFFITNNLLGKKRYQLTNHLGNVNVVITDRKLVAAPGSGSNYVAVVILKADYYPFGMEMKARHNEYTTVPFETENYRFGYNGMEKDSEIKGNGNSYTTEFRQYDPRLGRWLSLDPLMGQFPWMSPYVAFDNNPVYYTDPLGLSAGVPGDPPASGVEKNEVKVTGKKSISSDHYNKWLDRQGGTDFIRAVGNQIYESKVNAANNNCLGELAYGTNEAGQPNYPQDLLDQYRKEADAEAITAVHALYAEEKSEIDPNGLNYMFNPYASAKFEFWMLDAASSEKEANGIKGGIALDVVLTVLPIARGLKSIGKGLKRIKSIRSVRTVALSRCFVAGTKIATSQGARNIEEVQVGDSVWAFDEETDQNALNIVSSIFISQSDHLQYIISGNDTIMTTDEHPFYVDGQWTKAKDLVVGDSLMLLGGQKTAILEKFRIDTLVTVYNFEVSNFHTYYVGKNQVLVHNKPRIRKRIPEGPGSALKKDLKAVKAGEIKSHDTYKGRENPSWTGAKEYRTPNSPAGSHWRILSQEMPDGSVRYGWTKSTNYQIINEF